MASQTDSLRQADALQAARPHTRGVRNPCASGPRYMGSLPQRRSGTQTRLLLRPATARISLEQRSSKVHACGRSGFSTRDGEMPLTNPVKAESRTHFPVPKRLGSVRFADAPLGTFVSLSERFSIRQHRVALPCTAPSQRLSQCPNPGNLWRPKRQNPSSICSRKPAGGISNEVHPP